MLSLIKTLFAKSPAPLKLEDRDFGNIQYSAPTDSAPYGTWQMEGNWKDSSLSSASIPGDESGPLDRERRFILGKFAAPEELWAICTDDLFEVAKIFMPDLSPENLSKIFSIVCINTDLMETDDFEWEVCFESPEINKWLYVGLQIRRDQVVSNTIDT